MSHIMEFCVDGKKTILWYFIYNCIRKGNAIYYRSELVKRQNIFNKLDSLKLLKLSKCVY